MFALISPAGGDQIIGFSASGRAPAKLDAGVLRSRGMATVGTEDVHSITVPGAIDGFCRLAEDWGKAGLAASLAPAIRYAEEGVPVGPRTAFDWRNAAHRLSGDGARHYLNDGAPFELGDLFKAPGQAEVLRRVAEQGRDGFYGGQVPENRRTHV